MAYGLVRTRHADPEPVTFPLLTIGSRRLSGPCLRPEQTETSFGETPVASIPINSAVTRILGMIGSAIIVVQTGTATMLVSSGGPRTRLSATRHPLPSPAPCPSSASR
jgi:hypothetical protein